ncbi:hypothetical protein R5R35_012732 [Gryllus longicercus]|uniref:dolichyl-phosphate-mannose--protein mannosyltransferase n=1 Tax=Gryllus longicercus TaxID=2509291 RepID=A0AAN9VWR8_9ORTH
MNSKIKGLTSVNGEQNTGCNSCFSRTNKEHWDDVIPVPKPPGTLSVLTVAFFAILCYANSLDGNFVFDDSEAIVNNDDVRPEKPVGDIFYNDFWGTRLTSNRSHKSYRPLTVLSFRWNYWLSGGLYPWSFHLSNILLHALVSVLAHAVFGNLLGDRCPRAAFLAAILFAVHPVHAEAVAGVVGRADLLCALFFFLSFVVYRNSLLQSSLTTQCIAMSFSMILAGLAMFSKEQGITVIGLCSAYDVIVYSKLHPISILKYSWQNIIKLIPLPHKKNYSDSEGKTIVSLDINCANGKSVQVQQGNIPSLRHLAVRHIILFVTGMFLLLLRWRIMGSTPPVFQKVDNPASFAACFLTRAMTYNYLYALNAWLLLCPEWLCFDWSMGCVPLLNPQFPVDLRVIAAVMLWVAMILLLRACLNHSCSRTRRSLTMSLALLIIPFLPATNIFFHVGFVLAERVLYLPSAGFSLLIVVGMRQLYMLFPFRRMLQLSYVFLILIFISRAVWRSGEWRTEATLFQSGLQVCPLNAKVHYNIAKDAGDSGNRTFAHMEYREALRLNPDYDQAMNNLANLLKDDGKLEEAKILLRKAVELRPSFAAAWMNLGIVLAGLKQYKEAEQSYLTAIQHRKRYPDCYYNLGNLYLDQKQYDRAYQAWRNATRLKSTHALAWSNMIIMLDNIALPSDAALHFNLANTLGKAGRFAEAEKHFIAAISFDRSNAVYHTNLGVLYHRWKKYNKAEELYRRALEIEPHLRSAHENLAMLRRTLQKAGRQPHITQS